MTPCIELRRAETEPDRADVEWIERSLSHDFNNMLHVALSQASLTLRKLPADSPAFAHAEKVLRAIERTIELAHHLSDTKEYTDSQLESVQLNHLVQENVGLLSPHLAQSVNVALHLSDDLFCVLGNRFQLQQVFINLLTNAVEAAQESIGHVTVTTANRIVSAREAAYYRSQEPLPSGVYVTLEIRDNGPGIAPHVLHRVFEMHFTTKRGGHGVGLTTALQIIKQHGGGMAICSEAGRGTAVEVILPIAYPDTLARAETE